MEKKIKRERERERKKERVLMVWFIIIIFFISQIHSPLWRVSLPERKKEYLNTCISKKQKKIEFDFKTISRLLLFSINWWWWWRPHRRCRKLNEHKIVYNDEDEANILFYFSIKLYSLIFIRSLLLLLF